jgi:hypothetical protein
VSEIIMSRDSKSDALLHLADAISEDILNMRPEDLLAEVAADHGDRRALVTEFDRISRRGSRRVRRQEYVERLKQLINLPGPAPSLAIASIGAFAFIIVASALSGQFRSADKQPTNLASPAAGATEPIVVAAGLIRPNDRVDVVLIHASIDGTVTRQSDVLLQDIKVIAVDQFAPQQKDIPVVARALTLDVTPTQAQEILHATNVGSLSLVLRKPGDGNVVAKGLVTEADSGEPERKAQTPQIQAAPIPSDTTVTIIRTLRGTEYRVVPLTE